MNRGRLTANFLPFAIAVLVLALTPAQVWAQATGTVQGQVVDANTSRALDGARVFVVGTRLTAVTNSSGRYVLAGVPPGNVQLRVTRIGYSPVTQSVTVRPNAAATVDFRLQAAPIELEGLVVTATGEQLKREVGNAIAKVEVREQVEQGTITSFSDLLTGRAASVQVVRSGGTTGTGSRIRIRGSNSVSLPNDPVIYVDGVRVSSEAASLSLIQGSSIPLTGGQSPSRLDDIDPEQIESVEIIKGPSAVSLYGTKAANGVIWITTKKGETGRPRWNAFVEAGVVTEPNTYPANYRGVDANGDFCPLFSVAAGTCQQAQVLSFSPLDHDHTTPFRRGDRQKYGLSVSGGSTGFTYYLSGQFESEDGVMPVNSLRRANVRGNFGIVAGDNLDFRISTGYLSSDLALPLNDNFALGTITNGLAGFWTDSLNNGYGEFQPSQLFTIETTQDIERFTNSLAMNWKPADFLTARATVGLDLTNRVDDQFFPTGEAPSFLNYDLGARFSNRFQTFNYTADLVVTANRNLSSTLTSRTSVGTQYIQETFKGTFATGRQLVAGSRSIAAAAVTESGEETTESITLGAFVEEQIGYQGRLFVTGAVRADDNSAFGKDFNLVLFPKLSASWVISEEGFFPQSPLVNSLRLRAAWGESGLQPGTNDAIRFFVPVSVTADGQDVTGITFGGLGNPALKPERSREVELGLDVQVLGGRAGLEFTYYEKRTRDALVFRQLPPSLGVSTGRFENLGSVKNWGFEAMLLTRIIESPFATWEIRFNGSTNRNRLLSLGEGIEPIIFRFQRHVEGFPLGGYWDFPIVSFNDANGDGIIATDEVVVGDSVEFLGSPFPTKSLSIQNSLMIGDRIRIGGLLDFRGGQKLLNFTEAWRLGQNTAQELNDPSTPLDRQARAVASKFLGTDAGYIEDADFWKLREISVTFLAPNKWAAVFGAERLNLTLAGRNLATFTDYSGLDPEINETGQSSTFFTREFMSQPPVRYWTARVNVSF